MSGGEDGEAATARIILEEIKTLAGNGSITRRDVHQQVRYRTRFKDAKSLDTPLERLEQDGYIQLVTDRSSGGRLITLIYLNPSL